MVELDKWRKANGIPEKVFFKTTTSKPQFLDFMNPYAVRLIVNIAKTHTGSILFEEFLPNIGQMLEVNGEARAIEWGIEMRMN